MATTSQVASLFLGGDPSKMEIVPVGFAFKAQQGTQKTHQFYVPWSKRYGDVVCRIFGLLHVLEMAR